VAAGGTGGRRNPKLLREWSRRGMATGSGNERVFGQWREESCRLGRYEEVEASLLEYRI
jgi:hypothetical protein